MTMYDKRMLRNVQPEALETMSTVDSLTVSVHAYPTCRTNKSSFECTLVACAASQLMYRGVRTGWQWGDSC